MAEYIDKADALNVNFRISVNIFESRRKTAEAAVQAYADEIAKIPPADVRPAVRGEWGKSINPNFSPFDDSGEYLYRCNQCRHIQNYESNFCPNCGAKMEGKDG